MESREEIGNRGKQERVERFEVDMKGKMVMWGGEFRVD